MSVVTRVQKAWYMKHKQLFKPAEMIHTIVREAIEAKPGDLMAEVIKRMEDFETRRAEYERHTEY